MNVGELFVSLGVKGQEKTLGALTSMRQGLKDISSTSLEAKAAIIGVLYTLERLISSSGKTGTDLENFSALMGTSSQTLQQYQFAARQVGISNQEMEGTFKSLSATATKTLLGEGAPKKIALLAQTLRMAPGEMQQLLYQATTGHSEALLQKLQEYAQTEKNPGLRAEVLRSFGIGDNVIAGLTRNAFRPEVLRRAPTYSDKEVSTLDQNRAKLENLMNKFEMSVGHLNAKFGGKIIDEVSTVADKILKLTESLIQLSEKLHVFDWLGKIVEGWTAIFTGATTAVNDFNTAVSGTDPKKSDKVKSDWEETAGNIVGFLKESLGIGKISEAIGVETTPQGTQARKDNPHDDAYWRYDTSKLGWVPRSIENQSKAANPATQSQPGNAAAARPILKVVPQPGQIPPQALAPTVPNSINNTASSQTFNVNQTLNFPASQATNPKAIADVVKKTVKDAYYQIHSQSQAT